MLDDCATYAIAEREGVPVMTDQPVTPHVPGYEDWFGMKPLRLNRARFRELVIFDDSGYTDDKRRRFLAMGERLRSHTSAKPHPGVFILRGRSGLARILVNEMEIAERLRDKRGFRIIEPTSLDVPSIVEACAGARVVVGTEGSGLMHGFVTLAEGGSVLTLQPPNRFVAFYKHPADRNGQSFGFVVGTPEGQGFRIDPDEVERTLDLLPAH